MAKNETSADCGLTRVARFELPQLRLDKLQYVESDSGGDNLLDG